MISKSTLLHLRIPFSLFLLPFFLFAISQAEQLHWPNLVLSFIIIHLLFYPCSNGFNSYYDKDEDSIGGLKHPPKVQKELLWVSLALFALSLLLSLLVRWEFALMIFFIGLASKAYSHPAIRLKKFPFLGLLVVALFQGSYTFLMSLLAINNHEFAGILSSKHLFASSLCSIMLLGSYPMTQIYQHKEDARRGDVTISRILGVRGTFIWTGIVFMMSTSGFIWYFSLYADVLAIGVFLILLVPTLLYFFRWAWFCFSGKRAVCYEFVMRLNLLSSLAFILFFIFLILRKL
ncbi:MAG: UbiA family prenyltransferase [Cytophagaceae bacterium]